MPQRKHATMGAVFLSSLTFVVCVSPAFAGTTTAKLRVVATSGATLADQSQATGEVTIRTDPGATCFGPPGGSGNPVNVARPSALGLVKDASETSPALRPLSVTDQFSFGLGVCGIGGSSVHQGDSAFWYLKVNHIGSQVSGDKQLLTAGDEVLWYLSPGFPAPSELQLVAPDVAVGGQPFSVRVFAYNDRGRRSPVAGALVTGAELPTAADGTATVQLTRSVALQALHGADIPSNREIVCVPDAQSRCGLPQQTPHHRIYGTRGPDRIRGTTMPDLVRARGGRDHVNARGGLADIVNCGRGRDVAVVGKGDVVHRCERVVRKG